MEAKVRSFFKREVVYRFGIPHVLITDNGKQFNWNKFQNFCAALHIDLRFSSVEHPQTNGLTERIYQVLLKELEKRLKDHKGAWVDELYNVVWAYTQEGNWWNPV